MKPEKRELFEQRYSRQLALYETAVRYLKERKDSSKEITPKAWEREIARLTATKDLKYMDMKAMREELKAVERLKKAADHLARQKQEQGKGWRPEL